MNDRAGLAAEDQARLPLNLLARHGLQRTVAIAGGPDAAKLPDALRAAVDPKGEVIHAGKDEFVNQFGFVKRFDDFAAANEPDILLGGGF